MKNKENEKKYNSDITKEDLNTLGEKNKHMRDKETDDAQLKNRTKDVDFTGKGLDVPGRDLPRNRPEEKLKDEENQLYSQGSESNSNLEDSTER
ncbi:hypothetical protein [Winogradskyella ursingii]|uniref:hypothetical protein n=1 Tax=Winogradskyella ursingii TaxID=2686079 RepID=UPI0015CC27F5|nr:hypothetical protein [Winogradskyella ursingii]